MIIPQSLQSCMADGSVPWMILYASVQKHEGEEHGPAFRPLYCFEICAVLNNGSLPRAAFGKQHPDRRKIRGSIT